MADKPVVFISSTSDLRSARDLVGKVLYSMGYEPVWQDIAATEGGELLDVLRRRIEPCAVVLQLVGQRYGAEPPQPTPEFGRVSYTQFEALYAERLGRKVVYHFVAPDFPVDPMPPEADELVQLQARYKEKIVAANRLRHEGIASPVDLELSIRRINDELASLRRQAERRARRTLWLIGAALAGVAAVAALVLLAIRQQGASEARHAAQAAALQEELAAMRSELLAAVAPKPLSPGQARPDALSPELMEKARLLSENGNAEDQVLAKISLDQHDEANRIIQQLKAGADKPGGDPFSLLTLEGDNWYRAGQFDKAVGPYEKALALRPTDVKARNNVVLAHSFARLGNLADHQRRAIEVAEGTLKLVAPGSREWAMTQNNLGYAWSCLPTGDKSENLSKAIQCYGAALTVFSKTADPLDWAMTQNGLGNAWQDMPTGDKSENLRKAIDCLQAALGIFTKTAEPTRWAITESNLGDAWQFMPSGKKAENFRKAMACYTAALTVFTKTEDPSHWAQVQNNLGFAWTYMPTGDKAANLRKAIDCFQAALRVRTQAADPAHWAQTQNNLGNAWYEMPTGDKAQNLHKAIAYYEAVLSVRTKTGDPIPWAETQKDLGNAWQDMPAGDKAENLGKAIACYEAALTVRSKSADPTRWADTQYDLGNAWYDMPAGDKAENLRKAIACYQAALSVYTKSADSSRWGTVQYYLGDAWCDLPAGDQAENLRKAIACYQAALTVRSRSADPTEWADTQNAIASALTKLADVKGQDRAALLVQAIADDKAALEVYTLADYPQEHEEFQQKLQALRKVYESSAGPKAKPFDKIPAAQ